MVSIGVAWAFDGPATDASVARLLHVAGGAFAGGSASSLTPPSGVFNGPGALAVSAGSGLNVTVAAGVAMVAAPLASNGAYLAGQSASCSLALATADPTNPRIDLVCLQVTDNGDGTSACQIAVTTGTPAPSPSAPATPSTAIALAQVTVPAGATSLTSGNIADKRVYQARAGGVLPVTSAAAAPAGYPGAYGHDLTAGRLLQLAASGAKQVQVLPFAPVIRTVTSNVGGSGETTIKTLTVTTDGVTDIEVISAWNGLYGSGGVTQRWYIDSAQIDGTHHWPNNSTTGDQGGSKYYRTSSALSTTPTAGTHTIKWTIQSGTIVAASSYPATLHVRPLTL